MGEEEGEGVGCGGVGEVAAEERALCEIEEKGEGL